MALTRKMLKAMGIEEDKIDEIIEAHTESVDALKNQRDTYKADSEKLTSVQAELDKLKESGGEYKSRYEKVQADFDKYKADAAAKDAKAAKEAAVRAYYESKGITGTALEVAVRGSAAEIDSVEIIDGKIKDSKALDGLVNGVFSGLISQQNTQVHLQAGRSGGNRGHLLCQGRAGTEADLCDHRRKAPFDGSIGRVPRPRSFRYRSD